VCAAYITNRSSALLNFHALTGSNFSGRFASKTKVWWFKTCMSFDDKILDAQAMFRNDSEQPSDACSQFERLFVYSISPKSTQK
jgi:hypothetical protein